MQMTFTTDLTIDQSILDRSGEKGTPYGGFS
jgi:hypothetical protein